MLESRTAKGPAEDTLDRTDERRRRNCVRRRSKKYVIGNWPEARRKGSGALGESP